jgi:glycosyltransferase involved in cell wall biosynthesis
MTIRALQLIAGLDPAAGGPPVSAAATALSLRRCGVVNSLAFPVRRGREESVAEVADSLRTEGVTILQFRESRLFGAAGHRWGISLSLAVWVLRNGSRFDVIHAHSGWTFPTIVGIMAAKLNRRVAVLSTHESLTDYDRKKSGVLVRGIKFVLRAIYLRMFDVVITSSTLEQRDMRDSAGAHTAVVPHAVIGVTAARQPCRQQGGLRVGFLGRLHPKKNLSLLLEALALLPRHVTLHVAGDGPPEYRASLNRIAETNGTINRIEWLGFIDAAGKSEFLGSIHILAMPSAFECFGVAAAEALCNGVPVIVSRAVGIADVVAEYECGLVVEAELDDVVAAIQKVADDPETLCRLAVNAAPAARTRFSVESHGEQVYALYWDALHLHASRKDAVNG